MAVDGASRPHPVLTEPQARALAVGLRRLEEMLDQLDRLLDPPRTVDGRPRVDADLPPSLAAELRRELAALRARVTALAGLLGVTPERRSARRTFAALASAAWTTAADLHPCRLKAYGAVDVAAAQTLAGPLEELAAEFLALARRLEDPPLPGGGAPPGLEGG
jgi:hypothetical protein